ncbi:transposase [Burkholderia plantarii]|uniref:Putative membrane protein n=1 Tax=Burkholderia plantarii TaxID=41899 RepID=A0A0B6S3L4_BURPL|nr:transposase [Burkholderia plantarii]AJK50263.1 putative membrane protein [Burkholderia plantarii]
MFFDELSDEEWTRVSTLIADEPIRLNRRGRPRAETRVVANAILWILTTGEPWSKLPGRYPSGPTCRRRFEEWLACGTLGEMVAMLGEMSGRSFAYVPPPPELVAPPPRPEPVANHDRLRGVFWQNPESWSLPVADAADWHDEDDEEDGAVHRVVNDAPPTADAMPVMQAVHVVQAVTRHAHAAHALTPMPPATDVADVAGLEPAASEAGTAVRADHADQTEHGDHARPMSVRFATVAPQSESYRGYTLYGTAQPVQNMMYRAWAEIARDGRRIERSGLIGPRFSDPEAAERHAIAWGREWVDQHLAAEATAPDEAPAAAAQALPPQMRVVRPASAVLATLPSLAADRQVARHLIGERRLELADAAARAHEPTYREFAYQIG